jgi:Glycosyltransferase family 87
MVFPWYTLFALLFLIPFVDPRRPFRLLHLDLLVLLVTGVGPLLAELGAGQPRGSLALTVLGLSYLAVRFLLLGLRPARAREPLVPLLTARWLMAALVLVIGLRFGYGLAERTPSDRGLATVAGADRIGKGQELYDPHLDQTLWEHPDTYGPAAYLLYVPFEQAFPWDGLDAGYAAAISFDILVLIGLLLLARRIRPGPEGNLLGIALGYAWASYPYTLFEIQHGINDAVVACLVVAAYLAVPSAAGRGALAALAAATKFAPAILAPLLATGTGERRTRSWALFSIAFAAVLALVVIPLLPPGGFSVFWDRTLGFQLERGGYSIWAHLANPDWLRTIAQVSVAALALLLAFVPRRRSLWQLAALGAGIMAALQLTMNNWSDGYLLWLAPLAFAACFAAYDCRPEAALGLGERGKAGAASAEGSDSPAEKVVPV